MQDKKKGKIELALPTPYLFSTKDPASGRILQLVIF